MSSRRSQAYFGKRGVHMKARRFVFTAASALFAMAVVASVRTQATGSAPDPAAVRQAALDAGLGSLAHVAPPDVPNLDQFLNPGPAAMQAALVLGKAFFWDMQVGSDGQACGSCHFHAGADSRAKNQLSPGLRQLEIVSAVALGETNKEVAQQFSISEETVKRH